MFFYFENQKLGGLVVKEIDAHPPFFYPWAGFYGPLYLIFLVPEEAHKTLKPYIELKYN